MADRDITIPPAAIPRTCENCGEGFYAWPHEVAKGWGRFCSQGCHWKYADKTLEQRFWSKVDKSGKCWVWTTKVSHFGHGLFWCHGRTQRAHRVSYALANGNFDDGLCVLHKCDNPPCVNPAHLFLGTKGDNNRDRTRKGRSARGEKSGPRTHPERMARGERHGCAKLTENIVREIRARYRPFKVTRKMLTAEYGVSRSLIDKVLDGHIWKHV